MLKKYKEYAVYIIISLAVGGLAGLLAMGSFSVYSAVARPPLAPPPILFPIVWSVLYILMGISAGIIAKKQGNVPFIFYLQLAVNFFWPLIFFNMQAFLFAFLWLILLFVLIIAMIAEFLPLSPIASALQLPYLLWTGFAGYLNFFVWLLNSR